MSRSGTREMHIFHALRITVKNVNALLGFAKS